MNYKLICWNDCSIPVPVWANWLAWDEDKLVYVYKNKPTEGGVVWKQRGWFSCVVDKVEVEPPEPGPWTDQLYWIGD